MSLGVLNYPKGTADSPIRFEELRIPDIYKEVYIENIYGDVFGTKKDMVVIDIGANIGIVTQYMREYAKKVYAIEPTSYFFEALKKNKEDNGWDNVELFNFAMADRDGVTRLSNFPNNRTMNSITTDYKQGGETTKTMAIDTFFRTNNIDEVDFIKMDVENSEDMILRSEGFLKVAPKVKAIEVEFHNTQWGELVSHMVGLGFYAAKYDNVGANIVLFTRQELPRIVWKRKNA